MINQTVRFRWLPAFGLLFIACIFLSNSLYAETDYPPIGSLRDLERRARHAQALAEQINAMEQQLAEAKADAAQKAEQIIKMEAQLAEKEQLLENQTKSIADKDEQIQRRDEMLRLFRSGAFEYYQVIEGDTLASIAGNPMVYGDAERAIWIAYANAMEPDAELKPGTVLIIPRFTEGVNYGF